MRIGRCFEAGRGQAPMVVVPNAVHRRLLGAEHALAADQKYAAALARQLNYNNPGFNFNNSGGYAGTGYGGNQAGFNSDVAWKTFTNPIYVVPASQPKVKVWMVNEEPQQEWSPATTYPEGVATVTEGGYFYKSLKAANLNHTPSSSPEWWKREAEVEPTLRTGAFNEAIQANFVEVPMPELSKVLFGSLPSAGTDGQAIVWQPSTGGLWEMHRLKQFVNGKEEGGHKVNAGDWKFGFGGWHDARTWNGIGTTAGFVSASGLYCGGGMVTFQDLIEVLRGGEIKHALGCFVIVRRNEFLAPAVSHDTAANLFQTNPNKGGEANPAWVETGYETKVKEEKGEAAKGWRDAVPEGAWFRYPETATAAEFGLTGALETAVFNAIRKYGLVVQDGGGACGLYVEDYHTLGSPYCYAKINPYGGYNTAGQDKAEMERINGIIPGSWTDSTLPKFTEQFESINSMVYKLWEKTAGSLQQIEPFSS